MTKIVRNKQNNKSPAADQANRPGRVEKKFPVKPQADRVSQTTVKPTFKELENAPHDQRPLCGHRDD
ncbi:MAG: hypothetical protein Q7T39_23955, partial [Polaromonas sp.]|nr:hypothetical protein [Polaromonas sp.]